MSDQVEVTEDSKVDAHDLMVAKHVFETLDRHYPGHPWMVNVDHKQGVITIREKVLSSRWGYVLHINGLISATDLDRKVMLAGGEILERFKMKRGAFDGEEWAGLSVNPAGLPEFSKD